MLTTKQERFARFIFQGMTQREAWGKAGYSTNYSIETLDHNASVAANSNKIKTRLNELRDKAALPDIMTVIERKVRLSDLAREDIVNDKGMPVRSSNIASIQELNKADGVYDESGTQDNRVFNLIVTEETAERLAKVQNRTKQLPGGEDAAKQEEGQSQEEDS